MKKNLARYVSVASGLIFLGTYQAALATLKDDIGYTQLQTLLGAQTPTGIGMVVTQVESGSSGSWMPDAANAQLIGKSIYNQSAATPTGTSSHATGVAKDFTGTDSVSAAINEIRAYDAGGWLTTDFLNTGTSGLPDNQIGRIANHSWVASGFVNGDGSFNAEVTSDALRRVDWLIETDEFLNVVGTQNNEANANLALLSSAFNVITVGKTAGSATGSKSVDSLYSSGRSVPHVVTPYAYTSNGTPLVSSVAALLIEHAHNNPSLSQNDSKTDRNGNTLYQAEYASVLKALIMAGADRSTVNTYTTDNITDYRIDPSNQSANGLDKRYGAGQVNVFNSYTMLQAGEQDSEEDGNASDIGPSGFDYDESFGGSSSNSNANYGMGTISNASEIKISLVWNIDIKGVNRNSFDSSATLHNLDLSLIDVTAGSTVALSASTIDNTENITHTLEAGHQYKIQVNRTGSNFNWNYALAWQVTTLPDFDSDGIPDNSDPDIDNDGIDNDWETLNGLDPYNADDADSDADTDGLTNLEEHDLGTNPQATDTDGDGLTDYDEISTHGTNPIVSDTDNDGVSDYDEVNFDGDASEYNPMTDLNPFDVDTDGDGVDDARDQFPLDPTRVLGDLNDYNKDGIADIAWFNSATRWVQLWLLDDSANLDVKTWPNRENSGDYTLKAKGDVDGDGDADLIWLDPTSGWVQLWNMEDGLRESKTYPARSSNLSYELVDSGDFDGDGDHDILFVEASTGWVQLWIMEDGQQQSKTYPAKNGAINMEFRGVGDLDNDGDDDLIWGDQDTGWVEVWEMEGGARVGRHYPARGDTGYQIVGVGDVDGDQNEDIVFYAASTGWTQVWTMASTALRNDKVYPARQPDVAASFEGVGDANGDGYADLVWQLDSGWIQIWRMGNNAALQGKSWPGKLTDSNWQVQ
jgi:hypothetical protein